MPSHWNGVNIFLLYDNRGAMAFSVIVHKPSYSQALATPLEDLDQITAPDMARQL